ncbi:MAG: IclR family transcriptional regulator [Desulfobacteraceae bacterium]|nr:MAG: IclR family transcriptional regulator [Desulfobacteraceae bacterium]
MTKDTQKLNSIEKAIEILLKFQEAKSHWGIRELSAELSFSPATVQRILQILKSYDFVRQDPATRQYFIGNIFYRFLQTLNATNSLTVLGKNFLNEVARQTKETVHLNVIEDSFRICIDHIESPMVLKASMPVGHRSPLYAGASAKCLLAFSSQAFIDNYLAEVNLEQLTENTITQPERLQKELESIRSQGYAISLGERTPGLGSLSVPVFDYDGLIQASLSLAVPEVRIKQEDHLEFCINILVEQAGAFSKALGFKTGQF